MKQRAGVHHTFCRASEEQTETIFRQTGKKWALIIKSPGVCSSDLQFRDVRVNISYICTSIPFYLSSNSIEIQLQTFEISMSQDTSSSCYWFFWQHYVKALWKGGLNSIPFYSIQYVFIDACVGTSKQAGAHHPRPQINPLYKSPLWEKDNTKLNQPQLRLKIQRSKSSRRGSDLCKSQYFTPLWLKLCACL